MAADRKPIHVAVGVIKGQDGRILISKRGKSAHQGGLWEFPGGKVEHKETVGQALKRELEEELGIQTQKMEPLINIIHHYPDLTVLLDVWQVEKFSGLAKGCEGQDIKWVNTHELSAYDFPVANLPIIKAVALPSHYAILEGKDTSEVLMNLRNILGQGVRLIQVRLKSFVSTVSTELLEIIKNECEVHDAVLMINSALKPPFMFSGIHLTSQDLLARTRRPENFEWVSASCHNQQEIDRAESIGVDFIVLAPVLPTASHPGVGPMGWKKFSELTRKSSVPVYALGGLQKDDLTRVKRAGGQGVAGISAFL